MDKEFEAHGIPFLKVGFHAAKNINFIMQKLLQNVVFSFSSPLLYVLISLVLVFTVTIPSCVPHGRIPRVANVTNRQYIVGIITCEHSQGSCR